MRLTVQGHYTDFGFMSLGLNVRFGSQADICAAKSDVRFAPNSDCESGHPQPVTSALPARMCGAKADVALPRMVTFISKAKRPLVTAPDQQFGHRAFP